RQPTLGDDLPEVEVDGHVGGEGEPAWDLASLDWEQVDDRLKAAVQELPDHYREVLLLWAVEGLKYREIADVLGVALGTVMSRLYRARAILTEKLADLAQEHGMTVQQRSASA
ncbi:MAG: sigma-70 family RNA polymerase sigma factor, partial [Planctomycetota bacterium]